MDFRLDAEVECIDGSFGRFTTFIVDPDTEKVTYIAVKDASHTYTEYLVPIDKVESATADLIKLSCTREELTRMKQFIETEFITIPTSYATDNFFDYSGPETVVVEHQLVPSGTLAVSRGMSIEATDGYVGTVDDLMIDPTGRVSHLVLHTGHLWGDAQVTLTVSQVDRVEDGVIYLKLDQASINTTPMVQARRLYSKKEINVMQIELLIFTFDDAAKADQARRILKTLDKKDDTEIRNTAVLIKEQDGKTKLKETEDVDAKHGALFGAVTGGLIGLLGGPVGAVIGAAAGAATGRVAADKIDRGFSNDYLAGLQDKLQPGSSALVTLVEKKSVNDVLDALAELDGQLVRQGLTDEVVSQLTANDGE